MDDATAAAAGGFRDTPNQRLAISHVSPVRRALELAAMPLVHRDGATLRIGDVVEGSPPPIGDAVIGTGPGLMLIVEKQPGANTLAVTRGVEAAMETLRLGLPNVDVDMRIFRLQGARFPDALGQKPGTSLPMQRITVQAAKELMAVPGVQTFGAHLERAEAADEVVGAKLYGAVDQPRPKRRRDSRPGQGHR
ncbi:MAG: hypothetical protein LC804_19250 [Acidobacteria bacterium]|nr:hypothetical protein [Acidobacteriota bacterium]